MPHTLLQPVALQERIQTIDIIRGIALLGILIINFTVDNAGIDIKSGFGDQFVYWAVRLFMDDRFQSMYCFLFGLGFAIQMQRAAVRNSFFGFAYLRRMIALYLIMVGIVILTGEGYNVLPYYAMVGVLLLLFWKVPIKYLPWLAIFFFILPFARNSFVKIKNELRSQQAANGISNVDTSALDQLVGVYEERPERWTVMTREGIAFYGQGLNARIRLFPVSETEFILENRTVRQYFIKDSSGKVVKFILRENGRDIFAANKINKTVAEGLKKLREQKVIIEKNEQPRPSYTEFVKNNTTNTWRQIKNWYWKYFLWTNNYKIGYILVLFLLGMYAGKRKIFYEVSANRRLLIKIFKWGMIIGGAGILMRVGFEAWVFFKNVQFQSYSLFTRTFIDLPWDIGRIVMALAYIAGLTLVLENPAWKKRLSFFGTVGRMGLTNYILHLFAYMIVFDKVSWFLGLDGKIGCLYRILIAFPVYIILYVISLWWLRYFKQGPFEWLWRSLTYLKFQPMRLKAKDNTEYAQE